ncbi:hypothetical protein ZWY2020_053311 [Hordeum vulgare]|nr:hypothetical protein ZWY2020_053311 [Hordeum vulgare]
MAHHPRRSCLRRVLTIAGGVSAGLILLAGGHTYAHGQLFSPSLLPHGLGGGADCSPSFAPPPFAPPPFALSPLPPYLLSEAEASPPQPEASLPRRLLPVRRSPPPPCLPANSGSEADRSPPQHDDADAVLLPDGEVLLLADAEPGAKATCAFQGGASSPASTLGRLPGSGRHAYVCLMPEPARSLQPLQAPLLLPASASSADCPDRTSLLNWSDRIAFTSATLDSGDVLVFAKGVNHAAGAVRCVYRHCGDAHGVVASFPAITSVQQEAGFSHSAATHQSSCKWVAFIDVDEFIFSPNWKGSEKPSKSMLQAIVPVDPDVGQVYLPCFDFAPSGQTSHPQEGVIQGYTCRLKKILRHKSLVLLDAVDHSLENAIHHFTLKAGFRSIWNMQARVNHYKYQAWSEFKYKFKRRVSAYVADWRDPINLESADRAPGLGVDGVEPVCCPFIQDSMVCSNSGICHWKYYLTDIFQEPSENGLHAFLNYSAARITCSLIAT